MIRMYGDLANPDLDGTVHLHHAEDDVSDASELQDGLKIVVWDDVLEAEGTLEHYEGGWRTRMDWQTLTDRESGKRLPERYWR